MAKHFDHGYAVLIAVDQNAVPSAALPDVAKDVAGLRDVLVHPNRCGYAADKVRVTTGKDSTRDGIMAGLDWLRDRLKADPSGDATAVIYFTGHGHVEAGSYYLIPYDVNLTRIKTSAIRAEDLAADIAALQPRRLLVVLDCCHAAGMDVKDFTPGAVHSVAVPPGVFMQGEKGVSGTAGGKGFEALAQGAGRAVLSSSQASEQSYVRKDRKMSIFTYHLIEALTGHAQPQAGATEVLVSDMMSHVWRRVPQSAQSDWETDQHPQYDVSGNFPVALLLGGKGLSTDESAPDPFELPQPRQPAGTSYQATLTGSGAIAQGPGARAVGAGGVNIDGKNTGNINTGTQTRIDTGGGANIGGGVHAGRDFVGRDQITQGISRSDLEPLFALLLAVVAKEAPADKQAEALQKVEDLQAEVAKGKQADDSTLGKIIEGLVAMVPGAIGSVVSMFATPLLGGIAGPVTKFVLDKLKGS